MKYFIGIDVGTSSVKSLLMSEDGKAIGVAQREYDISKPQAAWAEQDIESFHVRSRELASRDKCTGLLLLTRIISPYDRQ